jgi:hypothetical protein
MSAIAVIGVLATLRMKLTRGQAAPVVDWTHERLMAWCGRRTTTGP